MMQKKTGNLAQYDFIDALGGMEMVNASFETQTFSRHVHEGYTIGLIEKGAQRFYRSGDHHIAPSGSIILVNADDVHDGEKATENGWSYRALYPLPEMFQHISKDIYQGKDYTPYFQESVLTIPSLSFQLEQLFFLIEQGETQLQLQSALYALIADLLYQATHQDYPTTYSKNQTTLLRVREYILSYPQTELSLLELANMAHLSQYHFLRQFKKTFGLTPHQFQIQTRLKMAKGLLKTGLSPAQVAVDCGFHDQSHLTRHFKKSTGTTPKQFMRNSNILL
ncbi:AraC family transcriptional regulator [Algicola sagamiensis]|uniref:AraC family transcriptional regulator n=1 Tax=Algicola sagamiensis TaxID=163869 RepID=UPI00037286C3|nr:AraC family transcriptional regulator [Algicola sagamiensis]